MENWYYNGLKRLFFSGNPPMFLCFGNMITSADFHIFREYHSVSTALMMLVRATTAYLVNRLNPN